MAEKSIGMNIFSQGIQLLQEEGIGKVLQEAKRAVPRRVFGRKTFLPYEVHFRVWTQQNQIQNNIRYNAPPPPFKLIEVDPAQVEYFSPVINTRRGMGQIQEGDWDTEARLQPIEQQHAVKGLREHFVEGKDWENTAYYERLKNNSNSEAFPDVRCSFVEDLYQSIRDEGYRPNYKAKHVVPEQDTGRRKTRRYQNELEPLVAIGRDGDIYWREGFHRLAVARILELETIPVQVITRHQQWQHIREKVYATMQNGDTQKLSSDLQSHPDLQEFY